MERTIGICGVWLADNPKFVVHKVLQDDSGRSLGMDVHPNLALGLAVGLVNGPSGGLVNSVHLNGSLPLTAATEVCLRCLNSPRAVLWLHSKPLPAWCLAAGATQPQRKIKMYVTICLSCLRTASEALAA